MSDGGCVALDYELSAEAQALPENAPLLVLFPGLTGGSGDSYVQYAVQSAKRSGIRAVVFNSRGTADSPILTPQFYSASFTGDTRAVINHLKTGHPNSLMLAAGWSLGANILLRYLGEEGAATPLAAAVSMCNPFDLTISNANFTKGFNTIYDKNLSDGLKKIFAKHQLVWNGAKGPARPDLVLPSKTIREFDDAITRHTFGWPSVDAYYAGSGSAHSIPAITIPFLCLQALDDPIAPAEAIPYAALAANPHAALVGTPCGGHLGWVAGAGAPFGAPWSDAAMLEWLVSVIAELKSDDAQQDGVPVRVPTSQQTDRELVSTAQASRPAQATVTVTSNPTDFRNGPRPQAQEDTAPQPQQQTVFLTANASTSGLSVGATPSDRLGFRQQQQQQQQQGVSDQQLQQRRQDVAREGRTLHGQQQQHGTGSRTSSTPRSHQTDRPHQTDTEARRNEGPAAAHGHFTAGQGRWSNEGGGEVAPQQASHGSSSSSISSMASAASRVLHAVGAGLFTQLVRTASGATDTAAAAAGPVSWQGRMGAQ
ncbi:MAG: hypothetical protein WDW38_007205 [Sanguina aurantia]